MSQPVAIITGAGRGIGRAVAQQLNERGYRLVLAARTPADLEHTRRLLNGPDAPAEATCLIVPTDVAVSEQCEALVRQAADRFGQIDALVHCAGCAPAIAVEQMSPAQWREVMETNLSSAFYLAHAAWPIFRRQESGVVVNVSSLACRDPFPGFAAYGAAKAALNVFSLVLAREGREIGVRVHTVAPGAVETQMFRALMSEKQWPREKTLEPAEVARVIVQCVRGDLRHTSGEVIFLSRN